METNRLEQRSGPIYKGPDLGFNVHKYISWLKLVKHGPMINDADSHLTRADFGHKNTVLQMLLMISKLSYWHTKQYKLGRNSRVILYRAE